MNTEAGVYRRLTPGGPEVVCVPDAISFSESKSPAVRFLIMVSAVVVGVAGASLLDSSVASADALKWMFLALTLAGGFLSTWSPCGYSSLSLLRPAGRYSLGSVMRWTPTFITHAIGYAIGALMLGGALGLVGWLLFEHGYDQGAASRNLLAAAGFQDAFTQPDLAGNDRVSGGHL